MTVRVGLERLLEGGVSLRGRRVGLVTHAAAVHADLSDAVGALLQAGVPLVALFSPEHGLYGAAADGAAVADITEPRSGLPVYSLYGSEKAPSDDALAQVDLLVFDMQDVGARFYTYISTLYYVLVSAARVGVPVTVLDRPNPITGTITEGPTLEPEFSSFVGIAPIPLRYGLTIGELARFFAAHFELDIELTVVPMADWRRELWFDETGLPWVPTSPAIPHLSTAILYPGLCLLEGTNLTEGRGTPLPFEICGAPWLDGHALAARLNALALPGVRFRPLHFVPANGSRYGGQLCGGVQVHVLDRAQCRPLTVGLHLIAAVKTLCPAEFGWRETSWEGKHPHFDLLMGTDRARDMLDGAEDIDALIEEWSTGLTQFGEVARAFWLYP
jgi:uncharacterized protein YbbC (DUF1343 family)